MKVRKNNGCWPMKNVFSIPMEETENFHEQLNKYVIDDNFIPNENPVIIDEGDPVDRRCRKVIKFVFKWKVTGN